MVKFAYINAYVVYFRNSEIFNFSFIESLTTALTKQPQIKEVIGTQSRWQTMVESFVSAGVPLNVFNNMAVRNWMTKNVQAGETFPGVTSLRRSLQLSGDKDKNESILYLRYNRVELHFN